MSFSIRFWHWAKEGPDTEQLILSIPYKAWAADYAVKYARKSLGGKRWIKGEKIIQKHGYYAYLYAKEVIGGRWEQGEKAILKCTRTSWLYSRYVLKSRWEDFDKVIEKKKTKYSDDVLKYNEKFVKDKLPKHIENDMLEKCHYHNSTDRVLKYIKKHCDKKRYLNFEEFLMSRGSSSSLIKYYNLLNEQDKKALKRAVMVRIMANGGSWQLSGLKRFLVEVGETEESVTGLNPQSQYAAKKALGIMAGFAKNRL